MLHPAEPTLPQAQSVVEHTYERSGAQRRTLGGLHTDAQNGVGLQWDGAAQWVEGTAQREGIAWNARRAQAQAQTRPPVSQIGMQRYSGAMLPL